jgi:hypothetical protein
MNEGPLTNEEKRCLQMWFRQAIAKAEQDELVNTLVKREQTEGTAIRHRLSPATRHARRSMHVNSHGQELVTAGSN